MSQSLHTDSTGGLTSEEFQAAKKVAHSFVSAFKYYSLYPQDHAFSQNHLHLLLEDLQEFFTHHKSLRLDIEKYAFSYRGKPLFKDTGDEGNPAYLLTRDSILFLEFFRNIELREIVTLFDILNRHRNPLEEVEGDIATSLWHIPFSHISYEAADIFAMEAIDFDFSMFQPCREYPAADETGTGAGGRREANAGMPPRQMTAGSHEGIDPHPSGCYGNEYAREMDSQDGPDSSAPGLLAIAGETDLAGLTTHERLQLESYIEKERERDNDEDSIDILLIILSVEPDQVEFASILDLLEFEYFNALARDEYHLAYKICRNVKNISGAIGSRKQWATTLINMFFASLAKEDRYHELPMASGNGFFSPPPDQLKCLLSAIDTMPAESMFILVPLAGRTSPDNLRQKNELLEIIERKAKLAPEYLLKIIEDSDESTCHFLFPIMAGMDPAVAGPIYLRMTHLPYSSVRRMGLDGLFRCAVPPESPDLIRLLGDEDAQIRQKIVSYLETLGGQHAEEAVIGYLQSEDARNADPLHVLQCYRALGEYLSDRAVDFLHEVLLGSGITSVFSKMNMIHKKGAAYALLRSGRSDARKIVQRGAASVRPDVRLACQKVLDHS